jgi:diguanylate cyclase (GGDEF)-like protein
VNDRLGHTAGDRLLVQAANRLRAVVRGADTVGRVGGDEFAVLLTQVGHLAGAQAVAERIVRNLGEPFALDGVAVTVGASVGVALSGPDDLSLAGPLARADAAMERAKRAGRGRVAIDQGGIVVPGPARPDPGPGGVGDPEAAAEVPPG